MAVVPRAEGPDSTEDRADGVGVHTVAKGFDWALRARGILTRFLAAVRGSSGRPHPTPDANRKFEALYSAEWAWRLGQTLGTEDDEVFEAVPDRLPCVSEGAQIERLHHWENVLRRLDSIRHADLSEANRINSAVYRHQIQTLVNRQRYREFEMPLRSYNAFWTYLRCYVSGMPFHGAEDYRRYIRFLRDFPRYFDENIANMRAGLRRGFSQPRVTLEGRDASVAAIAEAGSAEQIPFFSPFERLPASISAADRGHLRAEALAAIRMAVMPAYSNLLRFIRDEYIPQARTTLGADSLPDGKSYYRAKILEFVTLDLDPDEVHETGLCEVAKLQAEMASAMHDVGFTGTLHEFIRFLRSEPSFYAKTPEELIAAAAVTCKAVDGKLDQFFGHLPRRPFGIYQMPSELSAFGTGAAGGPGYYYLNTFDLQSRPLYVLPALTLHEAAPGHAFQIPISLEQEGIPAFRQKFHISAFVEGWALYAERLGEEMGIYQDGYQRFGMLSYQIYRAARLVVDTGIHWRAWSRDRAVAYMRDNTALNDHEIESEVDRYISAPAQALSYYLGASAIWRLRGEAEARLGEHFDVRKFHDTVLQLGSVPLAVLEEQVEKFISTRAASV